MISNEIRETLQRVCSILNKNFVDYMVVGGVAVGYYGYSRISGISIHRPEIKTDLDFWYKPSTENFINLVRALESLDVNTDSIKSIVFDPKRTFLKIPHKHFHTDFLPTMEGLDSYQECKKNAIKENLDGNDFYIIGYKDLIKNKIAVSRDIDKSDINELGKQ